MSKQEAGKVKGPKVYILSLTICTCRTDRVLAERTTHALLLQTDEPLNIAIAFTQLLMMWRWFETWC